MIRGVVKKICVHNAISSRHKAREVVISWEQLVSPTMLSSRALGICSKSFLRRFAPRSSSSSAVTGRFSCWHISSSVPTTTDPRCCGHLRLHSTAPAFGLPHDVGGDESAYGSLALAIDRPDELADWEVRCHSLFAVLAVKKLVTTDGLRRAIESLTPTQYASWTYYEKWSAGMTILLQEQGIVTHEDLDTALFGEGTDKFRSDPVFAVDDFVRVRSYRREGSGIEWRRPHVRVPGYIYGACGIVESVCDAHPDPSFLAFGITAPTVRLYRIRFRMKDIWPEQTDSSTSSDDVVEAEVYAPWLEPSNSAVGCDKYEESALFDHGSGSDCIDDHHHGHHSHAHDDAHSHAPRPLVETRAAEAEGRPSPGKELFQALIKILTEKGLVELSEVRQMAERLVMAGQDLNGATLVAKAWLDDAFKERLLRDAGSAAAEVSIATSNPNAPTVLTVHENTPRVHNLVVCTLCSCYPSGLLGIAPSWYKAREYRARAVREPREVLHEFGTNIPESKQIRVHDSTADHRYLVLPERPEGTEGYTEDALKSLVTRDTMVGVSIPTVG